MLDREKVIKGLECCTKSPETLELEDCRRCPYRVEKDCPCVVMQDALALLREQEPASPQKIDADALKERLNEICPPAPGATVLMSEVFRAINEEQGAKPEKRPRVLQIFEMKPGHLYWRETFEDGSMVLASKPASYDRAYRYWDEWPSKELREETLWDEDEDERRPEAWME